MDSGADHFWQGKNVVVPGGAGCLGSHLCDFLVASGARVTAIDDLSTGRLENLRDCRDQIDFINADLTCDPSLEARFARADVVMNLAGVAPGLSADSDCEDRHAWLYRQNVALADHVLHAALRAEVPRLLVVSSSCVYPDDAPVPTPELPLDKGTPEHANRGYGEAKRTIERTALRARLSQSATRIAIARPFNACSPRDLHAGPGSHVIPSLLRRLLSDDPELVVWGSGRQTRSFLDGADLARGFAAIVQHGTDCGALNLGSSHEVSMRELIALLQKITGIAKPVRYDLSKPEGALRKACDGTQLTSLTGFQPQISLETSLRNIVTAFQQKMPAAR